MNFIATIIFATQLFFGHNNIIGGSEELYSNVHDGMISWNTAYNLRILLEFT